MDKGSYRIYMGPTRGAKENGVSFSPEQIEKTEKMLRDHRLKEAFRSDSTITVEGVIEKLKVYTIPTSPELMEFAADSVKACFKELVALFPDAFFMLEHDGTIIERHKPTRKTEN